MSLSVVKDFMWGDRGVFCIVLDRSMGLVRIKFRIRNTNWISVINIWINIINKFYIVNDLNIVIE